MWFSKFASIAWNETPLVDHDTIIIIKQNCFIIAVVWYRVPEASALHPQVPFEGGPSTRTKFPRGLERQKLLKTLEIFVFDENAACLPGSTSERKINGKHPKVTQSRSSPAGF
jgi:hypothetical protein